VAVRVVHVPKGSSEELRQDVEGQLRGSPIGYLFTREEVPIPGEAAPGMDFTSRIYASGDLIFLTSAAANKGTGMSMFTVRGSAQGLKMDKELPVQQVLEHESWAIIAQTYGEFLDGLKQIETMRALKTSETHDFFVKYRKEIEERL
jgi:hypothetical protein